MAYSVIDKVYTIFIDVMTGSSNGYGKPTFYNTDSHTSFIELTVTNGSKEFNMTEFSYMFTVEKPDGTKYTNEYTTQDKSKLVIPVDAQMISCTGNCNAQLYVNKEVDGVNKTLTMVEFNYTVYKGLHEGLISESIDFDNVYVKILNKLDYIINNGADLTGDQAAQLSYAYQHSKSPHAPANIVETMHTEIGKAIDAHHKKVALSASQVGSYEGTDITIKPSNEGLTKDIVIKGRTLQNLFPSESTGMDVTDNTTLSNGVITCNPTPSRFCWVWETSSHYKEDTVYTIIIDILGNSLVKSSGVEDSQCSIILGTHSSSVFEGGKNIKVLGQGGRFIVALRTKRDFSTITTNRGVRAYLNNSFDSGTLKYTMMVIEGDYTQPNSYIPPYFEGIKSVGEYGEGETTKIVYGSHGKNLLDFRKMNKNVPWDTNNSNKNVVLEDGLRISRCTNKHFPQQTLVYLDKGAYFITKKVTPSSSTLENKVVMIFYEQNSGSTNTWAENRIDIERSGYYYVGLEVYGIINDGEYFDIKEIGLYAQESSYEPYQEDIKEVTANISGGLKGITGGTDDVAYINPENGQVWIEQNVGHYTSVGDEAITIHTVRENTISFNYRFNSNDYVGKDSNFAFMCNCFKTNSRCYSYDEEGCFGTKTGFYGSIAKSRLETPDLEGVKKYIRANFKECYYQLDKPKYVKANSPNILNLKTFNGTTHIFSKHDFKPTISFSTDFVPLTSDAKQYCTADGNKSFILPDIASLQDSNALEIHLFVKMLANATLSFPSNILWNDLAKMNEVTKGSTAEFIFTYIKTAEGGSWLGTVVPHK